MPAEALADNPVEAEVEVNNNYQQQQTIICNNDHRIKKGLGGATSDFADVDDFGEKSKAQVNISMLLFRYILYIYIYIEKLMK